MKRRHFTAGAGALLGAAALAGPAQALTTVTTQFLWIKNVEYAGFYVADADGLFRAGGIAPVFLAGGPNLASVEAIVAGGRADVGVDEFEKVVDAVGAGTDFVVFGAVYQQGVAGILSLPKNPVRTAADLVGKRIGLQQGAKQYIDGLLALNRLPLRYNEVPVGFDPDPLVEGACDAYLCYLTSQPLTLAARHIPYVATSFASMGYSTYAGSLFCTRDYLHAQRDTLVHYVRALARGWERNAADPARAAALAATTYGATLGLDLAQQVAQNEAQIPLVAPPGQAGRTLALSKERVAGPIYRSLRAMGRANLPPVERLLDLTIVRDAGH
jgi:ABC-type nitrate/sulfonate/bicarbonate transport system substrate-binding protein